MQFIYRIEGMHCEACVEKIKSALSPYFKVIEITQNPPVLKIESDKSPLLSDLNSRISLAGKYYLQAYDKQQSVVSSHNEIRLSAYYPLFVIAAYITGITFLNNFHWNEVNWSAWMNQFMAGFFLVFSAFKLLDIRGFAEGYATYDLLARRWHAYGFIYPFIELTLGILYLMLWFPASTRIATMIIMGFSSMGVINSLLKKQKLQCACLGTILKIPLSSVTLIEDLTMVILAALGFVIN